jgi:surfeit locus 1 family protein
MDTRRPFVSLRFGRYHLSAGLWPTLATLLLLPLLAGLGQWQLQRAAAKQQLQDELDRYQQAPARVLAPAVEDAEALRFRPVTVRGRYETAHQILLDNRVHRGQAGYHVLTPLRIENSGVRVLVNRGWVATGPDRRQLPAIDTPSQTVEINGVAMIPSRGIRLGAAHAADAGWPTLWQYLDMAEYAQAVPFPVQPVVVLLDPHSPAGGLVRDWARLDAGIRTHQGYALTWFSLALALLAIYFVTNTRREQHVDP